jgi:hypothetical protein
MKKIGTRALMVSVGGVVLLCSLMFGPLPCSAMEIWSDDFNDGDHSGWTVIAGNFSVSNNTLQAEGDDFSCIIHPSPVTTGTWSFDVYLGSLLGSQPSNPGFWFMMDMEVPVVKSRAEEFGPYIDLSLYIYARERGLWFAVFEGCTGYGLRFAPGMASQIRLLFSNGEHTDRCAESPSSEEYMKVEDGWHHIDVTRNSDGRICIYLDEMLYVDAVQTGGGTTSNYFVLYILTPGVARTLIDNIVVTDTIDIEPPSPETPFYMQTWFLATVGVAVTAVVIGAVWMLRRKAR